MARILIETTVRQTLNRLREDPERSVRNLVDMARQFSEGRFQNQFFETAHAMLDNENSAYYPLIHEAANHIETEHLVRFGMNVGYNSLILGAHRIRKNKQELKINIPWMVLFELEKTRYQNHLEQYHQAIREGEMLGIYSWTLLSRGDPRPFLCLALQHPNSAFFLFCPSGAIRPDLLEEASAIQNLMLVIRFDDSADDACMLLRQAQLPYSVFCPYTSSDVATIVSGDCFDETQNLHPIFTVLVSMPDCQAEDRAAIYDAVVKARMGQHYQTVPWELWYDTQKVEEIISDTPCCVAFDRQGMLHLPAGETGESNPMQYNLFQNGLTDILRQAVRQ